MLCYINYSLEIVRTSKHLNLDRNLNISYIVLDENVDFEYCEKE